MDGLRRLHEKKGVDLLLTAFAKIAGRFPSLHLVVAGSGQESYQAYLQKLASDLDIQFKVTWLGMVHGDLKWGAFHAAEVFILPSHQENFGIAVAEALACGKPVLISNKVNIWREIEKDSAGFVENDDLEGTAKLLERWMNLEQSQKEIMQSNALSCFETRFEMKHVAQRLIACLKK